MELFPKEMMPSELTMEEVAKKFDYFFQQIHLLHLQTPSYAEHMCLNIWDKMPDYKDEFIEKLSGYEGRKLKMYKALPISDYSPGAPQRLMTELREFAGKLQTWARSNNYSDIDNMAQSVDGDAAKVLFLLTLS